MTALRVEIASWALLGREGKDEGDTVASRGFWRYPPSLPGSWDEFATELPALPALLWEETRQLSVRYELASIKFAFAVAVGALNLFDLRHSTSVRAIWNRQLTETPAFRARHLGGHDLYLAKSFACGALFYFRRRARTDFKRPARQ